ncbi:hypothetical protein A2296_03765 [candidate division CPR3 bacterium RIFOXYB2_FULL_35_8]|nr:MAG: hypothetical protein A2250_04365 [candidate division CPR3 bacterium RIFOXYA2_FULL_35_13]OGB79599.1 MAG: hypothetical protein A2296_03765 [candidate division CPR3 bacterium RIFOXYB2_FULL_35_8]
MIKGFNLGLSAIAVTDHDSISGISEAMDAGEKLGIEVVPGVELSTLYQGKELHLLGYYIDIKAKWFLDLLHHFSAVRDERALKIIIILQKEGYTIDIQKVKNIAKGNVGKPHVARAVIENRENEKRLKEVFGSIPSISDYISRYMVAGKVANVPKEKLEFEKGITYIKKLGGVSVIAHPGYDLPPSDTSLEFLKKFKRKGLMGIEAIYFVENESRTKECVLYYQKVAHDLNMVVTGGSDFHGESEKIGTSLGLIGTGFEVGSELLKNLKKAARYKR